MEQYYIKDDFPKRVARDLVKELKTITKNEEDIRTFLLNIIEIFIDLKRNNSHIDYKNGIIIFLEEKGFKIPKSMQNGIDESFMCSIFGYMDNVLLEKFDDLIKEVDFICRKENKKLYSENIDELLVKLIGNTDDKTICLNYTSSNNTFSIIAQKSHNASFLCQTNNIYDEEILRLEAKYLNVSNIEYGKGSTVLDPKFVGKNRFDCAIMKCTKDTTFTKEEYEKVKQMMKNQKDIFIYGEAPQNSSAYVTIQQVIYSLRENGKAVFIVPSGLLFKEGKDREIRTQLIKRDMIETVIQLPTVRTNKTTASFSIIVINKAKKNTDEIKIINAQNKEAKDLDKIFNQDINVNFEIISFNRGKKQIENDGCSYSLLAEKHVPLKCKRIKTKYFSEVEVDTKEVKRILEEKNDDVELLSSVAEIYKGPNVSKVFHDEEGEYKIIQMSALKDGEIDYSDIIKNDLKEFLSFPTLEKGDILLSCKGSAIKLATVDRNLDNYTVTQGTIVIRAKRKASQKYLETYLNSPFGRYLISEIQKGDQLLMISLKDIKNLPVIVPKTMEQRAMLEEYEEQETKLKKDMEKVLKKIKENREDLYSKMGIRTTYHLEEEIIKEKE